MTDISAAAGPARPARMVSILELDPHTKARNAAETRFRWYGIIAIGIALSALVILLVSILSAGLSSYRQTFITIPVALDEAKLDKSGKRDPAELAKVTTI